MCIVLLTTAHPSYALILINNRDEFILRPTSRPHWWTPSAPSSGTKSPAPVLSSRDLYRQERGTWLGVSKDGNLAVLTNYREPHAPTATTRSRGSIPAAWLGAPSTERTEEFVERILKEDGNGRVQDVGGFSLICGKLRPTKAAGGKGKTLAPLAVISNRAMEAAHVPWIKHDSECSDTSRHVHGLSNAVYIPTSALAASAASTETTTPQEWPKLRLGKAGLHAAVTAATAESWSESDLLAALFSVLDANTLTLHPGDSFDQMIMRLKTSVFIPPLGDKKAQDDMEATRRSAPSASKPDDAPTENGFSTTPHQHGDNHDADKHHPDHGFESGLYGTQRQTVLLVDWDGNVTYVERTLYDEWGREIARGDGDNVFKFKIEGWEADGTGAVNGFEA